ncbi:NotI family restriction endonuclease [Haladaptatus cibarius]|uniref:NotI family restriction endonuclease n=1 Tax=Haladaptatus cibarius TaxID=453847 RepID=UPI00067959A6|nr:NotI family restriction endonuclease [Haladaptatus cibarius]
MQPEIGKHPVEFYGHFHQNKSAVENGKETDHCPFIETTCKKRRKSEGESIGTCSVGYRGQGQTEFKPHCICPHRFETPEVLNEIESLFVDDGEYFVTPEVPLQGTSIDYVAGKRADDGSVIDFAGVEIQALDTTGSVWNHREAYFDDDLDMEAVSKNYGINWAMSLTKTMMQQAYKKGQTFGEWGENLIFLVQDVSIDYIRNNYDASGLRSIRKDDPVHFYSYRLDYNTETDDYEWTIDEKLSADIDGVTDMMVPPDDEAPPTRGEFCEAVEKRF